uniref:Complex I assembly factor TIMMDC1, mitochondrial n=1 Tax=Nothobranchius furzeri TaxID=105023 RepID=A0A8C6KJ46_NOTFU
MPRFFCFLLPRVHAADVAAAQTPPSSSSSTSPPELPDTGWERIRDLFDRDETMQYPEELTNIMKNCFVGAVAGFLYGGLPAARFARQRYIQVSQAEVYRGRVDAVRSSHHAAIRGFLRYGWRWSWRVSLIVTLFSSVSTGLSVYRDKDVLSNYVAAGVVTVGLYRLNLGLRGLVAGSVIGAVLGVPTGALILGLQRLMGETFRERRRRERRELYELLILDVGSQLEETSKDMQRIQELLGSNNSEESNN